MCIGSNTGTLTARVRAVLRTFRLACTLGLLGAWFGSPAVAAADEGQQVLAPGYGKLEFDAPQAGTYRLPPIKAAADGTVLLPDGQPVQLHDLYDDRVVVLSFIYSTCTDVNGCPLATFVLHRLKAEIDKDPELAKSTRLLTLSFDPELDTPEVMGLYGGGVAKEGVDWKYLTTSSQAALTPILDAYNQSILRNYDDKGNYTGSISHVLRVFLIGRDKTIRNVYSVSFLHPDVVLADIRTLLSGGEQSAPNTQTAAAEDQDRIAARLARVSTPALGLPAVPVPENHPVSEDLVKLGERLFFERRLSANGSLACSHCHIPEQGFTNNAMSRAIGVEGKGLRRNASSLYNVAYLQRLFLDGREFDLETAVWDELLNYDRTGNRDVGGLLDRLSEVEVYRELFAKTSSNGQVTMAAVSNALAAYMRTLTSGDSDFDRWRYGKEPDAIGESAQRGFALFTGKAQCASCHTVTDKHALFTDSKLHNTGLGWYRTMHDAEPPKSITLATGLVLEVNPEALAGTEERRFNDLGLYEVTENPVDRWAFRTPSLRNIALTAPYMHDGSLSSLERVVEFYNQGGYEHEVLDERIRPLGLTQQEQQDLVEFMKTLTGNDVKELSRRLTSDESSRGLGHLSER
jgi:cytochrome c peroxidase